MITVLAFYLFATLSEAAPFLRDAELARRARDNPVVVPSAERGHRKLYVQSVLPVDARWRWGAASSTTRQATRMAHARRRANSSATPNRAALLPAALPNALPRN